MRELLPHPVTAGLFDSPVRPGSGWPGDPAGRRTPRAASAEDVKRLASKANLQQLDARISVCRACPRLVDWREQVARDKRAAYADQPYWGRPVPGWGDEAPAIVILGLAPAAHGANRTGRNFTGDSSGDWLYASMHRTGLASQPASQSAGDGMALYRTRLVSPVRCAPPQNKPTTLERDTCAPWIAREIALLAPTARVAVCLGSFGWDAALRAFACAGYVVPRPRPRFGHAREAELTSAAGTITLLGSYHPSQHNTFTGRLTTDMIDAVFLRAREIAGLGPHEVI
jgi:uracil-DNA glycosylase family 4